MYVHKLFELFSDVTDQGSRMGVQIRCSYIFCKMAALKMLTKYRKENFLGEVKGFHSAILLKTDSTAIFKSIFSNISEQGLPRGRLKKYFYF